MGFSWGDLLSVGAQAGGAYLGYRSQEKKQKELESQYKAYNAAKTAQAALAAQQGGGSRSGGGGGGGGGGKAQMQSLISQGYADYNKMLQPYIDESNKALPAMSALYGKGIQGMSGFSDQVFNPEFMKKALTLDGPPEMNLPDYLVGAKKNA